MCACLAKGESRLQCDDASSKPGLPWGSSPLGAEMRDPAATQSSRVRLEQEGGKGSRLGQISALSPGMLRIYCAQPRSLLWYGRAPAPWPQRRHPAVQQSTAKLGVSLRNPTVLLLQRFAR